MGIGLLPLKVLIKKQRISCEIIVRPTDQVTPDILQFMVVYFFLMKYQQSFMALFSKRITATSIVVNLTSSAQYLPQQETPTTQSATSALQTRSRAPSLVISRTPLQSRRL